MLQQTPDIITSPPYDELRKMYSKYFSLGYLNTTINNKFALVSLICFLTFKAKSNKPDVTHNKVIKSITKDSFYPEDFLKGLAVVCEDFSYGCTEFPIFNIQPKDMVKTVKELLTTYRPF